MRRSGREGRVRKRAGRVLPTVRSGGPYDRSLEKRVADGFSVTRTHGEDLSTTMGRLLFQDVITCVSELVANSYDADATHVEITYKPDENLLLIVDNGEGMDKEGIQGFYRVGDSAKRINPVSSKFKRRRIGEFGVATLALKSLTTHYVLETNKDGNVLRIEENFSTGERDDKPINVVESTGPRDKQGTTIRMLDLAFLRDGRRFTSEDLMRRLAVEMPLSSNFSINVNGQTVASKDLGNAIEYVVDVEDPLVGRVRGSVFYSPRPLGDDAGIYLKVDGRAVGGSNLDLFGERFSVGLARRLYGVLHVDGMRDLIGLDRKSFLRDHPKFKKVADYVFGVLRQVRQDMDMDLTLKRTRRTDTRLEEQVIPAVGRALGEILGDVGVVYNFVFDSSKAGSIARFDKQTKTVYVNPSSPACALRKIAPIDVKDVLLDVALYAVINAGLPEGTIRARHEALSLAKAKRVLGTRKTSIAELLGEEGSGEEIEQDFYRISPNRLYNYREVTRATGWSNALIKRMVESGVLENRAGDRVLGSGISSVLENLSGRLSLYNAVRKIFPEPKSKEPATVWWSHKENQVAGDLDALVSGYAVKVGTVGGRRAKLKEEVEIPPYIKNLARSGKPSFWVVDETHLDLFGHFVSTGELRDAGTLSKPIYSYVKFKNRGSVVFYAFEIEGDMTDDVVRSSTKSRVEFVEDEEGIPMGIRTRSWCATYLGHRYVVGAYVGDYASVVDELPERFNTQGFKREKVPAATAESLYEVLSKQRTVALPITISGEFNSDVAGVLASMLGIKGAKLDGLDVKRKRDVTPEDRTIDGEGDGADDSDLENSVASGSISEAASPGEQTNGTFGNKYYACSSLGSARDPNLGIIIYAVEIRDSKDTARIKRELRGELSFVYSGGQLPEGIKGASYFSSLDHDKYVFGVYVGNVKTLEDGFHASGFDRVDYSGRELLALYVGLRAQPVNDAAMKIQPNFDRVVAKLVGALSSRKVA